MNQPGNIPQVSNNSIPVPEQKHITEQTDRTGYGGSEKPKASIKTAYHTTRNQQHTQKKSQQNQSASQQIANAREKEGG
jgi:hypothetical protein